MYLWLATFTLELLENEGCLLRFILLLLFALSFIEERSEGVGGPFISKLPLT